MGPKIMDPKIMEEMPFHYITSSFHTQSISLPTERARRNRERELGPDHLEDANTLHDLGVTERNLMNYERVNELPEKEDYCSGNGRDW